MHIEVRVLKSSKNKKGVCDPQTPFFGCATGWLENKVQSQDHIDPVTALAGIGRISISAAACGNLGGGRSVSNIIVLHRQMQ